MADENKEVVVEQVIEQPAAETDQTPKTPEYSDIELRAMDQGWMPKDKWVAEGRDPEEHRTAKEYVDRSDLYKRIESLNKQNKDLHNAVRDLIQHNQKMEEVAYKKAVESLKQKKIQALEEGDARQAADIDEEILDLRERQKAAPKESQAPAAIPPEFEAWVAENRWYASDSKMRSDADTAGIVYKKENPSASNEEVLKHVTEFVKAKYPTKFSNPKRSATTSVETGDVSTPKRSTTSDVQLTEEETRAMKRFVRTGVMTEADYKAQIKKMRG